MKTYGGVKENISHLREMSGQLQDLANLSQWKEPNCRLEVVVKSKLLRLYEVKTINELSWCVSIVKYEHKL
jgi:hypothetical protein